MTRVGATGIAESDRDATSAEREDGGTFEEANVTLPARSRCR